MNKEDIIRIVTEKMKLVRIESGYTQERMAELLGMSKKTLVQIEKGRNEASWTQVVALCALFSHSEILENTLGDSPLEILEVIAHGEVGNRKDKTLGGKVWWRELERKGKFRLQQNVISQHVRILDDEDYRYYSSFDLKEGKERLNEIGKA